ncbi:MAG: DNA-binding response regulator, partial [Chloroflexi bacterium]
MTTIVLAEDRATVRQIVRLLLEDQPDFTVV